VEGLKGTVMPKPYMRTMPKTWWLRKPSYFRFMLRELTAVFVALYCVMLMILLWRLKQGPDAYQETIYLLQTPGMVAFHFIAFVFSIYHSVTWFHLMPKVIVIRSGEEKVPGAFLVGAHYVGWLVVSALLIWLVF
jgi:fumarate reductase subunit C